MCLSVFSGVFLGVLLTPHAPSFAQDAQARLERIENEIQTLSRAVFRGEMPLAGAPLPGSAASASANTDVERRIAQIELEVRTLTGQMEQQGYEVRRLGERVEQALADMDRRMSEIEMQMAGGRTAGVSQAEAGEQGVAGGVYPPAPGDYADSRGLNTPYDSETTSTSVGGATDYQVEPYPGEHLGTIPQPQAQVQQDADPLPANVPPLPEGSGPTEYYEQAFSFLRERNNGAAQKAFEAFLAKYPDHNLASNARYWLGETHYVRGDFERAARIFAETYQLHPKSSKGPDSLLKLGLSLAGMGKKQDACLTLSQLKKEYPAGISPVLTRAQSEMTALGCK